MLSLCTGKHPIFFGPEDDFIAVIEPAGKAVAVFSTVTASTKACLPLYTLSPESATAAPGVAVASVIFSGPPSLTALVRPKPPVDPKRNPNGLASALSEDIDYSSPFATDDGLGKGAVRGAGVIMWQAADCVLAMATIPLSVLGSTGYLGSVNASVVGTEGSEVGTEVGGESSEEDEETAPSRAIAYSQSGQHFGPLPRQAELALLPDERVLQVSEIVGWS